MWASISALLPRGQDLRVADAAEEDNLRVTLAQPGQIEAAPRFERVEPLESGGYQVVDHLLRRNQRLARDCSYCA
jgi:hypothetical protein